ncbi:hypothetical protein EYF80_015555 [Liparis tanakae]|uniref:Uncharacterized protein n=1 Tax=Liparis tanakae TaxID=230148 RepID=A0A4Z2IA92_9TELE|nr:hypothetical protein EYF80_015555 [Liparis tanakae]
MEPPYAKEPGGWGQRSNTAGLPHVTQLTLEDVILQQAAVSSRAGQLPKDRATLTLPLGDAHQYRTEEHQPLIPKKDAAGGAM